MTLRRLGILQWVGLLLGAAIWASAHILGFGITQAECGAGGRGWGIDHDVWEGALLASSALVVLLAEGAAIAVLVGTRNASYEDPAPEGRLRFFAIAAATGNVIFLLIVVLDLFGTLFNAVCRGG